MLQFCHLYYVFLMTFLLLKSHDLSIRTKRHGEVGVPVVSPKIADSHLDTYHL